MSYADKYLDYVEFPDAVKRKEICDKFFDIYKLRLDLTRLDKIVSDDYDKGKWWEENILYDNPRMFGLWVDEHLSAMTKPFFEAVNYYDKSNYKRRSNRKICQYYINHFFDATKILSIMIDAHLNKYIEIAKQFSEIYDYDKNGFNCKYLHEFIVIAEKHCSQDTLLIDFVNEVKKYISSKAYKGEKNEYGVYQKSFKRTRNNEIHSVLSSLGGYDFVLGKNKKEMEIFAYSMIKENLEWLLRIKEKLQVLLDKGIITNKK